MSVFHFLLSVANRFIKFADTNMKSALLSKPEFTGMNNITYSQAKSIIATWSFDQNINIESFDELQYFKSLIVCPTFSKCVNLQSIIIPDNVITIPANCFNECTNTVFGNVSKNVTSVGENAFNGCTELEEVDFKDTNFTTLNRAVFKNCSSLRKAEIPNVTVISHEAFSGCAALSNISLDWDKITNIGVEAFKDCNNLPINSIIFSANSVLSTISSNSQFGGAFKGSSIKNITINNNIMTALGGFRDTSMTSIVAPNVTSIDNYGFEGASVANMMSFPNVNTVNTNSFYLTYFGTGKIDLYNVIKFGNNAFYKARSLTSLGDNFNWSTVKYIGQTVFIDTKIQIPNELFCKFIGHASFWVDPSVLLLYDYVIFRFDGSDISDIDDYPNDANGRTLIRQGVVGFGQFLSYVQSPFQDAIKTIYVPDSKKQLYLDSIWGRMTIRGSSELLTIKGYSEAPSGLII